MATLLLVVVGFGTLLLTYAFVRHLRRSSRRLIEARENCEKTWSDIEVLLQRRHSELEQLIDLTNEHVAHEREMVDDILGARKGIVEAQTPEEAADIVVSLVEATQEIYTLSDEYPELESNDRFEELSESIRRLEQRLENRREQYNEAVSAYNSLVRSFPESIFASYYGFTPRSTYTADPEAHRGLDVSERMDVTSDAE
jgi:LemA protein